MHYQQSHHQSNQYILQDRLSQKQIHSLNSLKHIINQFTHQSSNKPITLLTSGGTSVPLQKNTVRSIQNFSTGLRGSKIAQSILQHNSPLILFYRSNSILPYTDGLSLNQSLLSVSQQQLNRLLIARQRLLQKKSKHQLLLIPFTSIYMYLNGILQIKKYLPKYSIVILCAAVSDFIPKQIPTHKITTSQQLILQLTNSPKILNKMISEQILCVSFKLQTDVNKLEQRIQFALNKYKIDIVIGNILGNKQWIKIHYNRQRFHNKSPIQHQANIQQHIWNQIYQAYQQLFNNKL